MSGNTGKATGKTKRSKTNKERESNLKKTRIPLWGKVIPVMALGAGIVAAIAGSGIMGDNLVKVQEPISVAAVEASSSAGTFTGVTYNDDLSFEVTAETYPGDNYDLNIGITNNTSVTQVHRITLDYADGFRFSRVEADQGSGVVLTQDDVSNFVFEVDSGTTDSDIVIHVEVLPQVLPGWYTISGVTEPLETDLTTSANTKKLSQNLNPQWH